MILSGPHGARKSQKKKEKVGLVGYVEHKGRGTWKLPFEEEVGPTAVYFSVILTAFFLYLKRVCVRNIYDFYVILSVLSWILSLSLLIIVSV